MASQEVYVLLAAGAAVDRANAAGITPDVFERHVSQRQAIIEDLCQRGISDIQTVTSVVQNFYAQQH